MIWCDVNVFGELTGTHMCPATWLPRPFPEDMRFASKPMNGARREQSFKYGTCPMDGLARKGSLKAGRGAQVCSKFWKRAHGQPECWHFEFVSSETVSELCPPAPHPPNKTTKPNHKSKKTVRKTGLAGCALFCLWQHKTEASMSCRCNRNKLGIPRAG